MKTVFYILILLLTSTLNAQQNLVPNGSFEEYDTCPYFPDQINFATGWMQATTGTSDYFNECYSGSFTQNVGIPSNFTGYQYAYEGKGYCGFYSICGKTNGSYNTECEYIETQLLGNLLLDSVYNVSFYISVANYSNSGIYNLGVLFTDTLININNFERILVQPSYAFDTLVKDTANWIKMSFDYKANGTEQFMTIGKFDSIMPINSIFDSSATYEYCNYVYIDSVSIIKKESQHFEIFIDTIDKVFVKSVPNIFTPNKDNINDYIDFSNYFSDGNIIIYNRWGNEVFKGSSDGNLIWTGENLSDGVYFYVINTNSFNKQGTIHLIR